MNNKQMELMAREHDIVPAMDAEVAEEVVQVVVDGAKTGYQKIEEAVVGGYKKIETGVVKGFSKVTDKCVEVLFAKDGESVEDAKKRLSGDEK